MTSILSLAVGAVLLTGVAAITVDTCTEQHWENENMNQCMQGSWCGGGSDWSFGSMCDDFMKEIRPNMVWGAMCIGIAVLATIAYYVARLLVCCKNVTCCECAKGVHGHDGVTDATLRTFRIVVVVVALLYLAAGGSTSIVRATKVYDGLNAVNASLTNSTEYSLRGMAHYQRASLEIAADLEVPENASVIGQIHHFHDMVSMWAHDVRNVQYNIMNLTWLLDICVWAPFALMVVVLLCSFFNIHRVVPEILVFFLFLLVLAPFTIQSTFGGLHKTTDELCLNYDNIAHRMHTIFHEKVTPRLTGISNTTEDLGRRFIELSTETNQTYLGEACETYWDCPVLQEALEVPNTEAYMIIKGTIANDSQLTKAAKQDPEAKECVAYGNGMCSIEDCLELCTGSLQELANGTVRQSVGMITALEDLKTRMLPTVEGDIFTMIIFNGRESICGKFKSSLVPYAVATGVVSFLALVVLFLAMALSYCYEGVQATPDVETYVPLHPSGTLNEYEVKGFDDPVKPEPEVEVVADVAE